MITVYDFLEVNENASKEEIEKAYQRLILEYHTDPKLSDEENKKSELILNKLKIAYEILIDDEKRKKYDKDLATKRAEELINNVSLNNTEMQNINNFENKIDENEKKDQLEDVVVEDKSYEEDEDVKLSLEEKKRLQKAAKKEFNHNLKKAQKAEEEYNKAYNEAYNNYLRKQGYIVNEPWTLKRIMEVIIALIVIIGVFYLIWIIPPTRNLLIKIYEQNFIIKSLVDIVVIVFNAIINTFKQ